MNSSTSNSKMKGTLILSFVIIAMAVTSSLKAQHQARPGQRMYFGLEGSLGTRSFKMKSDIEAINKMPVSAEGGNFGLIFGNKLFHTKIKQGYFNSSSSVTEKFKTMESEAAVNLYPMQMNKRKFRYFEPYFMVGVERNTVKLFGTYAVAHDVANGLAAAEAAANAANAGNGAPGATGNGTTEGEGTTHGPEVVCGLPSNPDGDLVTPEMPVDPATTGGLGGNAEAGGEAGIVAAGQVPASAEQNPYVGKIVATRANIAIGLECHVPGLHHFINLFAEAKYGIPLGVSTNDAAFKNTKTTGAFAVNFGISFGISR